MMMIEGLETYEGWPEEKAHKSAICDLLKIGDACFYRNYFDPGHITGSAFLLSADGHRVLLNHHRFLNMWIFLGGHADGEKNILNVALREAQEESGIDDIEPVSTDIFNIDVHAIPANAKKGEPPHKHHDLYYLFKVKNADSEKFSVSPESNNLRWCDYGEAKALADPNDACIHRALDKWRKRYA